MANPAKETEAETADSISVFIHKSSEEWLPLD
jgi:hypothetical protein